MKKFTKIIAIALVFVTALFLVSCSSYGKVEKAFKNEGYTVSEDFETAQKDLIKDLKGEDGESAIKLHALTKIDGLKSTLVVIIEFNSTDELVEYYKNNESVKKNVKAVGENEDVKAFYDALVEAGIANGNCLVFTINPLAMGDVANIVKNA